MTRLFLFILLPAITGVKAQRVVVHTDLIPRMQANTEYKIMMNKRYEDKLNQVKEDRENTLAYGTTIEQVQRRVFNSLTNVDDALRNGKTVLYISKKIP